MPFLRASCGLARSFHASFHALSMDFSSEICRDFTHGA
jgi:hypothetical protein